MMNTSNRPHILGHVHCSHLQWLNDALPYHYLWVVILDTLDLMVLLLKRHFGLSRNGITTEGVNAWVTHPQSSHEHTQEPTNVHGGLRGITCLHEASCTSLISPIWDHHHLPHHWVGLLCCSQGPSGFLEVDNFGLEDPRTSCNLSSSRSQTSLISSIWNVDTRISGSPSS